MLSKLFNRHTDEHRLVRLALLFALAFAAAHVALHDRDINGGVLDGHGECQICRLNHVPVTSLAIPSLVAPLHVLAYVLAGEDSEYKFSTPFHARWARAPPLF